jgi:hypothetical protein
VLLRLVFARPHAQMAKAGWPGPAGARTHPLVEQPVQRGASIAEHQPEILAGRRLEGLQELHQVPLPRQLWRLLGCGGAGAG